MHLNVVRMLETSPCTDCLSIGKILVLPPDQLRADLFLTHPVEDNLKLTGFDVRGIFITGSDFSFPFNARQIAWGTDFPMLLNQDGYTNLFNPTDFEPTSPVPPALKYTPGKFSSDGDISATLNPFIAYCEDQPRGMFLPGQTVARTVVLRVPPGPFSFGYAVDASWKMPPGEVVDPSEDFPDDANCVEPYRIDVEVASGFGSTAGSTAPIIVEVFDHQGLEWIDDVFIEAPDLFEGQRYLIFAGYGEDECYRFSGTLTNEKGAPDGEYPLLVRVVDKVEDPNLGLVDAWQVKSVRVGQKVGWARTWGGIGRDACWDVAVDGSGNVLVAGTFEGTVDFDPGDGVDIHSQQDGSGAFSCMFDPSIGFQWAKTWGKATAVALELDDSGNIYAAGQFLGTVDFDPGSGVDERTAEGLYSDNYLSRFDASGGFQWVRTWGALNRADSLTAITGGDMGAVYVTGDFTGTVDFDPGDPVEERTSNGFEDVYLSKLDYYGNLEWVRTWGGPGGVSSGKDDESLGLAVGSSDAVYAVGNFHTKCDFDPGPGVVERIPVGLEDAFLSAFSSSGNLLWTRTWGGSNSASAFDVAPAGPDGSVVTGYFRGIVDFDPGSGVQEKSTGGTFNGYLSRFSSNGDFLWVRTFGSFGDNAVGAGVSADSSGNILVSGFFDGTADLDGGPGTDLHSSNGWMDAFLVKMDPFGEFLWAGTWGGEGFISVYIDDEAAQVAVDADGNPFVVGHFENSVDFEPGPGEETVQSEGLWDAFLVRFRPDGSW